MDHGQRAQEQDDSQNGLHHLLPAVANFVRSVRIFWFGHGVCRACGSLIWDSAMSVETALPELLQSFFFSPLSERPRRRLGALYLRRVWRGFATVRKMMYVR